MGKQQKYDLEERTFQFAERIIAFTQLLPRTVSHQEITRQLISAAGSIGANYIEANESLGKKDFQMRIRISKKESKESCYWLQLLVCPSTQGTEQAALTKEATVLMNILGAILRNSK